MAVEMCGIGDFRLLRRQHGRDAHVTSARHPANLMLRVAALILTMFIVGCGHPAVVQQTIKATSQDDAPLSPLPIEEARKIAAGVVKETGPTWRLATTGRRL